LISGTSWSFYEQDLHLPSLPDPEFCHPGSFAEGSNRATEVLEMWKGNQRNFRELKPKEKKGSRGEGKKH
jgi:hypothetical protein